MNEPFPPAFALILGALLLALLQGHKLRQFISLVMPVVALVAVWMAPAGYLFSFDFLGALLEFSGPAREAELGLFDQHSRTLLNQTFGTVFSIMAFVGALFAFNQNRRVELPAAFLYAGSALGVVFAQDWLTMFVFWELMAVGSTIVIWCGGQSGSYKAGTRYAMVHFLGGVILMLGIVLHLKNGGSPTFSLAEFPKQLSLLHEMPIASWLILIGMLINAAAPPFSSWLPDAYPEASVSGTVFLSAYTTKTAVFTLMLCFHGLELLQYIGVFMALYGIVYAILENDVRRILAYSIINQVGFMICGIGIGTTLALNGTAGHAFAHIIYKALLLMSAGSVLYQTGMRKCTDVGGLYRTMPITMWCGIIGAMAISAFPLTSGFVTKSMITSAAAENQLVWVWLALAAASAGVFLHAGIKFPWFVFFQKDSGLRPSDPPKNMNICMIFFAALCIVLGLPGAYAPLYNILPFTEQLSKPYAPFTVHHVVLQLQLLLFAGLAFFLLLPILKRTLTITLDFDWFYRVLAQGVWNTTLLPLGRALLRARDAILKRIIDLFGVKIHIDRLGGVMFEQWLVGKSVLMITLILLAYAVLNFNWKFLGDG